MNSHSHRESEPSEAVIAEPHAILNSIDDQFRQVFELAPTAMVVVATDERFICANQAFCEILGYSPHQLVGTPVSALIYPQDRPVQAGLTAKLHRYPGSRFQIVERCLHADGRVVWCQLSAVLIADDSGEPLYYVGQLEDISARRHAEQEVLETKEHLQALLNASPDMIFLYGEDGRLLDVNDKVVEAFGYSRDEIFSLHPQRMIGNGLPLLTLRRLIRDTLAGGTVDFEWAMRRRCGETFPVEVRLRPVGEAHGGRHETSVLALVRDITERKEAEKALAEAKERAQTTLQSIGDGVITTDSNGCIDYMNPVAIQLTGYAQEEAFGRSFRELFTVVDEHTRAPIKDPVKRCLKRDEIINYAEHKVLVRYDGGEFAVKLTIAPISGSDSSVQGVVLIIHDVTEMWAMARQLSYQAAHDPLTGLINRREFERRLESGLHAAAVDGRGHALCYMDLDQFKIVNDTCGHTAGDELLKQLSCLLSSKVRENDSLARLGGDEFGLLLEGCSLEKALERAESIRHAIEEFRFAWNRRAFEVGVSIGLVPITSDSVSITEVLSAADSACYVAKDRGRNRIHVYQPDDTALAQHHGEMEWVNRIKQALNDDRFRLLCQPIKALAETARTTPRYEILLRMIGETGEEILPAVFLPAAERYHLMPTIDRWVITWAFDALSELSELRGIFTVNLSGQSLGDECFLSFVMDELASRRLDPQQLCFEITETAAVANLSSATEFIGRLREMGCAFALDDFGSGLSSFGYLKTMPVDYLKIDGSFVRDMADDAMDRAMVESINQIGHVMGIQTVAECVEHEDILVRLRALDIDYAQGFGIAPPRSLATYLLNQ